ncbi:flagellar export protein FliJ [Treponema primitia]|uniref:flagellar export protein FliJ n=1 Tax=Treponema primitia TaxID=88058 RepID=UPI00397EF952
MKRFRFGLQRVLELREYAEREAEIELGKAVGALTLIEQHIAAVAEDRLHAAAERFAPGNGLAEMQNYDRYILRLDQTRDKLLMDAAKAELVVAEKRDIFLEASRERKVLDKIKDKRKGEYRKFAQAEENKELDDIAARMTRN